MKNRIPKIFVFCCLLTGLFFSGCTGIRFNTKKHLIPTAKDKERIAEYLLNKQYIEFESLINELLKDKRNSEFIDSIYSNIASNNNILQNLNEWCESRPASPIAHTARGYFYIIYAWEEVDKDYGNNNNPEDAITFFTIRLNAAKTDLEKAGILDPADPHAATYLITVAKGLNLDTNYMETQFQHAIKADPYNLASHINKLNYFARKWYGSHDKMIEFALETLNKSPDDNDLGLTIITMAQREMVDAMNLKNQYLQKPEVWKKVNNKYMTFIKNNPENLEIHVFYAEFAMLAQKYDIALKEFELIKNKFYPSMDDDLLAAANYRAYRNFAYSLYGIEKYWEAIEHLKRMLKISKSDSNTYKLLAYSYNKTGDEKNVIKYAKAIINLDYKGVGRYHESGYLLYELKKYKEAAEVFQDTIKYYGDDAYSYQYLAFCYSELNMYQECIDYAKKYLEINPDSDFFKKWIHKKQLYYLFQTKKYVEAMALANEMIKNKENEAYAYRIIAYCYDSQENYKKAADYAEKAMAISPDYKILKKWIRKRRIYYLFENHYCKETIEQTLSAIEEFGNDADFYRILSHSYYCIKDYIRCIESGKKSLSLNPEQKIFEEWLNDKIKESQ
ncbi:tetratricopeptide repeat protein [Candidatus Desantisbacteria bacterium]|nr:tetratricopeptide repeat protein [Candidatus Desantisbacteria bacterium]